MKNIVLILIFLLPLKLLSQTKKDSIPHLIFKGTTSCVLSTLPIIGGVGVIMDGENVRTKSQSYVFFGVGAIIDLDAVFTFRRAKYLSKHKM